MGMKFYRAWRLLRATKFTSYILLMLGPMFIRPLAFIRQPSLAQPAYAKLPGLWKTPLLAAGIGAATVQSVYQWGFWWELKKTTPRMPPADLILELHKSEGYWFWGAFFIIAILLYALAFLHWCYHFCVIHVIRRWRAELSKPPLKYFVVTTAAWGMWFSIYSAVVVYSLWRWEGQRGLGEFFSLYVKEHQLSVLAVFLIIGVAWTLAGRNSSMGMKALYGGSTWLYFLAEVFSIGAMTVLLVQLSRYFS